MGREYDDERTAVDASVLRKARAALRERETVRSEQAVRLDAVPDLSDANEFTSQTEVIRVPDARVPHDPLERTGRLMRANVPKAALPFENAAAKAPSVPPPPAQDLYIPDAEPSDPMERTGTLVRAPIPRASLPFGPRANLGRPKHPPRQLTPLFQNPLAVMTEAEFTRAMKAVNAGGGPNKAAIAAAITVMLVVVIAIVVLVT